MKAAAHDDSMPHRRVVVTFRVAEHEHHLYRAAAAQRGECVSEFLRRSAHETLQRELMLVDAVVPEEAA